MPYADSVAQAQFVYPRSLILELYGMLTYELHFLSTDSVAFRSDCLNELADLELQCPHIANVPSEEFHYCAAHTVWGRLFVSMDGILHMSHAYSVALDTFLHPHNLI